jgi:hypothetical protein
MRRLRAEDEEGEYCQKEIRRKAETWMMLKRRSIENATNGGDETVV